MHVGACLKEVPPPAVAGSKGIHSLAYKIQLQQQMYQHDVTDVDKSSAIYTPSVVSTDPVFYLVRKQEPAVPPPPSQGVGARGGGETALQGILKAEKMLADGSTGKSGYANDDAGKSKALRLIEKSRRLEEPMGASGPRKSVGFGENEVRIFSRFSKVEEQYPEHVERDGPDAASNEYLGDDHSSDGGGDSCASSDEGGGEEEGGGDHDTAISDWLSRSWGPLPAPGQQKASRDASPSVGSRSAQHSYVPPKPRAPCSWEEETPASTSQSTDSPVVATVLASSESSQSDGKVSSDNGNVQASDSAVSAVSSSTYKRPIVRKSKLKTSGGISRSASEILPQNRLEGSKPIEDVKAKDIDEESGDHKRQSSSERAPVKSAVYSKPTPRDDPKRGKSKGKPEREMLMKPFVVERSAESVSPHRSVSGEGREGSHVSASSLADEKVSELIAGVSLSKLMPPSAGSGAGQDDPTISSSAEGFKEYSGNGTGTGTAGGIGSGNVAPLEGDYNDDDDMIRDVGLHISKATLLGNLTIPSAVPRANPSDDDKIIWKELFGDDIPGSEDGPEESEEGGGGAGRGGVDAVSAKNFFMDMWGTLEDMFDSDSVSWLNESREDDLDVRDVGLTKSSSAEVESYKTDLSDDDTRQYLDANEMSSHTSLTLLLKRGFLQAEKLVNISKILSENYYINAVYNAVKSQLLRRIQFNRVNPSFGSSQWCFCALLIIDAILRKQVFPAVGSTSGRQASLQLAPPPPGTSNHNLVCWNGTFEALAVGLLGGVSVASQYLGQRELTLLRTFFDSDMCDVVTEEN